MAEKKIFPMIPETNWWSLRSQFQKTMPSTVSISYLKSLLNLKSDQSARNILSPLRQMKIVDEDGKPTSRANEWRSDAKYSDVCKAIVSEIYPPELADLFPDERIDISTARNWFMDTLAVGESAAGKLASTYALLRSEQIKSDTSNGRSSSSDSSGQKKTQKKPPNASASVNSNNRNKTDPPNFSGAGQDPSASPSIHIDLQIHISSDASAEQIDSIFASMARHLYGRE